MLYKLSRTGGRFDAVEPVAFRDFVSFGQLEKDLEDLIARNILGVLFEDAGLMPIYQERPASRRPTFMRWTRWATSASSS